MSLNVIASPSKRVLIGRVGKPIAKRSLTGLRNSQRPYTRRMSSDYVIMPDDYRSLLAGSGPGTLAGVLRLLAPGGPEGFNMAAEQDSVLAGRSWCFSCRRTWPRSLS